MTNQPNVKVCEAVRSPIDRTVINDDDIVALVEDASRDVPDRGRLIVGWNNDSQYSRIGRHWETMLLALFRSSLPERQIQSNLRCVQCYANIRCKFLGDLQLADTAPETSDVLIIGAGPSGSIAAALLSRKGHSCTVLERDVFPRFSIGESLLPQCMEFLEEADMLDSVREMQFQAKEGALFSWGSQLSSFDFSDQFLSEVWTGTYEVERAIFDSTLARRAKELGATVRFGHETIDAATKAEACEVVARDSNGVARRYRARFVLDASGFGWVLPRLLQLDSPSGFPARRSLFTHVQDRIEHVEFDRNKILVTIHPENADIWYWLIPFSHGRSSIGVVASEDCLDGFEKCRADTLRGLIEADPRLNALLKRAVFDSPVREISGYSANVKRLWGDAAILILVFVALGAWF